MDFTPDYSEGEPIGKGNFWNEGFADEGILEKIIKEEERRRLFLAIQKLPVRSKEILMESIYFHMDDAQIAREHRITKENVRQIRSRAKQKLILIMEEGSR